MTPKNFRSWRKSLHLSQKEAAHALGLKRRVVQYYEKGERDGESISIPKYIRLACHAIAQGMDDYHGPEAAGPAEPATTAAADGAGKSKKTAKAAKATKTKTKSEVVADGPAKPTKAVKSVKAVKAVKAAKTGRQTKAGPASAEDAGAPAPQDKPDTVVKLAPEKRAAKKSPAGKPKRAPS